MKTYSDYEHWKSTPLEGNPYLSIVIPAYNEANRIVPTIGAIAAHLSGKGYTWELIIADDGSKDETVQLVSSLGLVNMRVLKAPKNGGKGSAVRRGVLAARGKYILFDDADNSTPIEEIDRLLPKLEAEGFQMAVGSRAADGAQEGNKSLKRKILSYGLRFIVKHFFRIGVKDTQCGFKLYTREAAQKLHTAQTVMGFSFDLEILYLASKFGMQVAEVPVNWVDAPGSKVDPAKEARRFIKDLLRIRLNDLRGAYHNKRAAELRVAVVGTHPPSQNTLTEYGYHFIRHLRAKPDVSEVILICDELPAGESYQIPGESGLAPVTVVPAWKFGAWNNALRIWKAIRQQKPDVVLFNIQFASFASSKLIAALGLAAPALSRAAGYPTITLLHNIMETVNLKQAGFAGNPLMEALTRAAGKFFTRLLLRSDEVAVTIPKYVEILQKEYKTDKVVLAPHGAFNQTPEPVFDPNPAVLRLMTFGKFGTYKKVEDLVEAFQKLQARYSQPMELVIAGTDSPNTPGYLAGVQQQYAQVNNLRFTGYVPEEAIADLFTDSTVVIFPYTSTTGSSGVLHQAGEYGKAVVLPRLGDLAELVTEEGYSGEFFEPGNIDSLVNAISTLLDNPPYREEMGMRNYLAAQGLPMADVVDWYLVNFYYLLAQREQEQQPKTQTPLTVAPAATSRTSTRITV